MNSLFKDIGVGAGGGGGEGGVFKSFCKAVFILETRLENL